MNLNDILGMPYCDDLRESFFAGLDRKPNECWEWRGRRFRKNGVGSYGRVWLARFEDVLTHRLAWVLAKGPILEGLFVLHRCDNPPCCNPAHLFLGTHEDNMADMAAKRRWHSGGRNVVMLGAEHHRAVFTDDIVRAIRRDRRANPVIAAEHGVTRSAIWKIKHRFWWKHVAD